MKFSSDDLSYLNNSKFSAGFSLNISKPESNIPLRIELLESICRDKSIIHIGCVDHLQIIEQKIKSKQWLHERLCNVANRCIGIDNNFEGINFLKDKLGFKDVFNYDIVNDEIPEIHDNHWDIMVMGELLEHIDNPVEFIKAIKNKYKNNISEIAISVPNAFHWENIRNTFSHSEVINTDHRYWFTPYTLAKVVTESGLQVIDYEFCETNLVPSHGFTRQIIHFLSPRRFLLKQYPGFRSTIVMRAFL